MHRVYKCDICLRELASAYSVRRHVEQLHNSDRENNLTKERRLRPEQKVKEKRHLRPEQKVKEKRHLRPEQKVNKKHIRREASVERDNQTGKFICDCGRGYLEVGNLRRHQREKHGRPLKTYVLVFLAHR